MESRKEAMLCFLNGEVEGLSEGKHADYCIVKWLLISSAYFNPEDTTVALSSTNGKGDSMATCISSKQGLIVSYFGCEESQGQLN